MSGTLELSLDGESSPSEAMRRITERLDVARVELKRPTLEDIFVEVVGESGTESEELVRASLREGAGAAAGEGS